MLTVYKYQIKARLTTVQKTGCSYNSEFDLMIPDPGSILKMGVQPNRDLNFQVWALVDPDIEPRRRRFLFLGTGHTTTHNNLHLQFIDTWVTDELVFHLFEITSNET